MYLYKFYKKYLFFPALLLLVSNNTIIAQAFSGSKIPGHQTVQFYDTQKRVDQVLFLMQKRLCIIHEVSRAKWNHSISIEDKQRQKEILESLAPKIRNCGIDEEWVQKFFKAQLEAAKAIQIKDFTQWTENGINKFDSVLDLNTEIRPYLDEISDDLLQAVSKIYPEVKSGRVASFLTTSPLWRRDTDCIDANIWAIALTPFVNK